MTLLPARSITSAPRRRDDARGVADLRDDAVAHDDRLRRACRRAGAIDDADVGQRNDRRARPDVLLDVVTQRRLGGRRSERDKKGEDCDTHDQLAFARRDTLPAALIL